MRKILSIILALIMLLSLTVTAAASDDTPDAGPRPVDSITVSDETNTDENADVVHESIFVYTDKSDSEDADESWPNSLTTHPSNAYLYWVTLVLDEHPSLHFDASLKQYYLSFGLSKSTKLALIYEAYRSAFWLEFNTSLLSSENDIDEAIWKKPSWREKSIGEQLSKETAAKIRANSETDGYAALKLIQQSAEYKKDAKLKEQVDYSLHVMEDTLKSVTAGFLQISSAAPDPVTVPGPDVAPELYALTPAEICKTVDDYLAEHPEWKVLGEVRDVAMTGTTSKVMTTFEQYDTEKLNELYMKVSELARVHWPSFYEQMESVVLAVPFPVGTTYQWSEGMKDVAEAIEENKLPISATGE